MNELSTLDREAEQIVKEMGIPPCPATLTTLLREMRRDEPDYVKIGNLIGSDVGLAGTMLKTVNSPFYGLATKAKSVQQSLLMLGLETVSNLTTGLLLRQAFPVSASATMEEFWDTSSNVALISAHLARKVGVSRDAAYTFGLFRDCGIPLMVGKFSNYSRIYSSAQPMLGHPITDIEDQHYSMNHARVGYHLAKSWELEDQMCDAILWHHDHQKLQAGDTTIAEPSQRLIALALLAEQLYMKRDNNRDCLEWDAFGKVARENLDVSEDDYAAFFKEIQDLASEHALVA